MGHILGVVIRSMWGWGVFVRVFGWVVLLLVRSFFCSGVARCLGCVAVFSVSGQHGRPQGQSSGRRLEGRGRATWS